MYFLYKSVDVFVEALFYILVQWCKTIFYFPTEIIKKQGDEGVPDLVHVMRTLASESIPNLPPGGELASKWVNVVVGSDMDDITKSGLIFLFKLTCNVYMPFLSLRRSVIEAVYNKLNPYRSDDTVSIWSCLWPPSRCALFGVCMLVDVWQTSFNQFHAC